MPYLPSLTKLLAAIFILAAPNTQTARTLARAPRTMHPSEHPAVVELKIEGSLCTGWVVGKNRIATAAHCFGYPKITRSDGEATFQDGRKAPLKLLKAGIGNTGTDVAIALVDTRDITPVKLRSRDEWKPEFCYYVGFGGSLGKNQMPCYAIKMELEKAGLVVILHAEVIPGDSGGPIFGRDGEAIALTFAYSPIGDTGFAVPSFVVEEFLKATIPRQAY